MHGERGLDDKPEVEKAEPEELLDTDTSNDAFFDPDLYKFGVIDDADMDPDFLPDAGHEVEGDGSGGDQSDGPSDSPASTAVDLKEASAIHQPSRTDRPRRINRPRRTVQHTPSRASTIDAQLSGLYQIEGMSLFANYTSVTIYQTKAGHQWPISTKFVI